MAAFATLLAAEARCVAKQSGSGDGTWVAAHTQMGMDGTIGVRVQRYMSPTHPDYGEWVVITDDATA